jgi:hypothetical protein
MSPEIDNPPEPSLPLGSASHKKSYGFEDGQPLTPDLALAMVKDLDLPSEFIEQISRDNSVMKSRKVRLGLAAHPHVPRRIALRLIRELYTFDLMQFSLMIAVAGDLKRIADEILVARLASIPLGERISLARRSSSRVAAALLLDKELRVWQTALQNPRLSESAIVKALLRRSASSAFVHAICHHAKWSLRPEIRYALLKSEHLPLARALEFVRRIPPAELRDILHASRLPGNIKGYLREKLLP